MRLFVAVNLPSGERRAAHEATQVLRGHGLPVRWVGADNLHITLKFLDEVDRDRVGEIGAALTRAVRQVRVFSVTLGGIGAFPSMDRPRVVWLGVEKHPALELLANDVEEALAPLGFASELRPFHPHITLGRVERGARSSRLAGLATLAQEVAYEGMVPVESVDLMESQLGAGGARYEVASRAPLLPAS
ncbi:MAG TPA: RNA 2',3'-cyclic phosphodiesterase [Gemmatimonadales bacterium]|nr:RNA 2',3'-cyclic phosphodiesterase [Gemmatimonadales bacterium]